MHQRTALILLSLLLAGCGAAPSPTAAPRQAGEAAAHAADTLPRDVAKLLDLDGNGLIADHEAWISGKASNEAFQNFKVGETKAVPVATGLVERALASRGEVLLYGRLGATADGRGVAMTDAQRGRLSQGLARALAADPLAKGGIPVRWIAIRHFSLRDHKDEIRTYTTGNLANHLDELLAEEDVLARVKLVAGEVYRGRRHRLVLTEFTTF